ncbi:MAG: hypothetical protein ACRD52_00760 [Candidatus Acidiferrales bacterium]
MTWAVIYGIFVTPVAVFWKRIFGSVQRKEFDEYVRKQDDIVEKLFNAATLDRKENNDKFNTVLEQIRTLHVELIDRIDERMMRRN